MCSSWIESITIVSATCSTMQTSVGRADPLKHVSGYFHYLIIYLPCGLRIFRDDLPIADLSDEHDGFFRSVSMVLDTILFFFFNVGFRVFASFPSALTSILLRSHIFCRYFSMRSVA